MASLGWMRLGGDAALVVTGSLSAKPQDRSLERSAIRPVQVVDGGGVHVVPFFDDLGPLGVSSFVFVPGTTAVLLSTGDDLLEVELTTGAVTDLPIGDLTDVHEMTLVDGRVWLSNTGRDELVAVSLADGAEIERVSLAPFRTGRTDGSADESVDKFHVNQVFADLDGELHCLVHHVAGRQFLKRVAARVIKSQGDGGVLGLGDGVARGLGLSAPHSVRIVGDSYWIFDSGKATVAVFDREWRPNGTFATSGWGRGAAVDADRATVHAGMSPIRRRYLPFATGRALTVPAVESLDAATRTSLGVLELEHVEQVNNVYLVDRSTADGLLGLR
jgi:hypothetical protein